MIHVLHELSWGTNQCDMTINNANAIAPKNQTQHTTGNCVHKSFKPAFSFHLLSTSNIEIIAFEDVKWLYFIIWAWNRSAGLRANYSWTLTSYATVVMLRTLTSQFRVLRATLCFHQSSYELFGIWHSSYVFDRWWISKYFLKHLATPIDICISRSHNPCVRHFPFGPGTTLLMCDPAPWYTAKNHEWYVWLSSILSTTHLPW